MTDRIFLSKAHVTEVEEDLVLQAIRSGWVAPLGPFVDRFEKEMAERVGVAGSLALSSGTAAPHLALVDVGARAGRVVVLPAMTFVATANAVAYTGAELAFVDCRADDANVDVPLLLEAVRTLQSEGKDVAAVVTVDLFGRACDYTTLMTGLTEVGVPLIEDAAEALGATHAGQAAGAFGRSAALSFNGNKIMTTSGGGMLLSNDTEMIQRARYLSTQARQPVPWYEHTEIGYNYRMSNLLAAVGIGQLERLDGMIARRRRIRDRYAAGLADVPGLTFLGRDAAGGDAHDNCWLTCVLLPPDTSVTPDDVIRELEEQDIEARHLWKPMHLQPVFAPARMFDRGISAHLFARGVTLPTGSALSDGDIDRVIDAFRAALASS